MPHDFFFQKTRVFGSAHSDQPGPTCGDFSHLESLLFLCFFIRYGTLDSSFSSATGEDGRPKSAQRKQSSINRTWRGIHRVRDQQTEPQAKSPLCIHWLEQPNQFPAGWVWIQDFAKVGPSGSADWNLIVVLKVWSVLVLQVLKTFGHCKFPQDFWGFLWGWVWINRTTRSTTWLTQTQSTKRQNSRWMKTKELWL